MTGAGPPQVPPPTPLADTFRRLGALDGGEEETVLEVGRPSGERWLALDSVRDGALEVLLAEVGQRSPGRRDYPGAAVASSLAGAVVTAGWPALLLERRLPELASGDLSVHRHESEPWFDRIAVGDPRFLVLPDDPAASHPDAVVVPDLAALHSRFADALAAALGPWFAAIRPRASFGRPGMWGQAADLVSGMALWTARRAGEDQRAAWEEAAVVVDLLAGNVPELRARARLFPVAWRGSHELFQVRGTCCLLYRTGDDPDLGGDAYCTTCPLRSDEVRAERLTRWLEATEAVG